MKEDLFRPNHVVEGQAVKVTSIEFQQNVGRYQDAALQSPVAITKDGRPHTVLMSAAVFEVMVKGRVARPVEDLDDDAGRGNRK